MASRARLLAALTLAALSAVAALSLGRVVDSSRFIVPVLAAALLPHAIGAIARRFNRTTAITLAVSLLGLALFVILAREGSTTSFGIPGVDTWHSLDRQLTDGWHLVRTAPAPAPTTDGAILLAVIAVWCMAAAADLFAFRGQATLGAVAPALVFFVWTSTLGTADARVPLTVAFCLAAGAFLLAQNLAVLDRRRNWLVSRDTARRHWLLPAAALGASAVLIALLVAPVLPGAGSDPLLDFANTGRQGSAGRSYRPLLAPFVDIGAKLESGRDTPLFTVRSKIPDYWRIAALDTYSSDSGGQWTLSAEGDGSVTVGLPGGTPTGTLVQEFQIGELGERWLPAAYRPVAINLPDTLVVKSSGTIVANASSVRNLHYTVASKLPPLSGQVSLAQQQATKAPVPADLRRYTELPSNPDIQLIKHDANEVAAGATNPYAQAQALRDYFRDPASGFRYDTTVDTFDSGSAIVDFLRHKRGFCVQFASAYAVMARSLGIPARVAVGFTPGNPGTNQTFRVSSHDAHAWPEIWLAGLGWTHMFDPTPAGAGVTAGVTAGGSQLPSEPPVAGTSTPAPPLNTVPSITTVPRGGGTGGTGTPTSVPATAAPARPNVTTASPDRSFGLWLPLVAALLGLALLIAVYVIAVLTAKSRRQTRRRESADFAAAVTGAWEEALDRLREAHLSSDPALTPIEFARAAPARTTSATERPLRELARVYTAARYGDGSVGPDEARDAWTAVDEIEQALTGGLSWRQRWRRRLDPTPVL
ncbi:MAG: DUF3488 and DUF4129 domain-containing transglutaminase family protein [Acidimicrobiia bacterium]